MNTISVIQYNEALKNYNSNIERIKNYLYAHNFKRVSRHTTGRPDHYVKSFSSNVEVCVEINPFTSKDIAWAGENRFRIEMAVYTNGLESHRVETTVSYDRIDDIVSVWYNNLLETK